MNFNLITELTTDYNMDVLDRKNKSNTLIESLFNFDKQWTDDSLTYIFKNKNIRFTISFHGYHPKLPEITYEFEYYDQEEHQWKSTHDLDSIEELYNKHKSPHIIITDKLNISELCGTYEIHDKDRSYLKEVENNCIAHVYSKSNKIERDQEILLIQKDKIISVIKL